MATSFGALCTDFYINQKLGVKMDLPDGRETVLHLFDRIRADQPEMTRFRRFSDELSLESRRRDGAYQWMALRQRSIRSGAVNPDTLDEGYELHRLILKLVPYHLSVGSLDVDHQELLLGFDLDAKGNHHEIVYDALIAGTPLASLVEYPGARPLDVQPTFAITLSNNCDLQAWFEVKTSTTPGQIRTGKFRTEPISVLLTLRKTGPIDKPEDLLTNFDLLREHAERLANDRLVPDLVGPISRAITSSA
ncbi:MAG: hypothetical protein WD294_16505 [Phycisphaeraceae bacterium]